MRCVRWLALIVVLTCLLALAQSNWGQSPEPTLSAVSPPSQEMAPTRVVPPADFYQPVYYATNATQSHAIAVDDLNGDGKLDLVLGNSDSVSVMLGNGDGTFQPGVQYAGGATLNALAVVDMDGDGKLDLVAGNSGSVSVSLGNGDGTFRPAVVTNLGCTALAVADVDGDGIPDVVLATPSSAVETLLGNGDGTFKAPVMTATPIAPETLAVADLNHDGKPDAVIVTFPGLITNRKRTNATIGVMFGNGDGTFRSPVNYDTDGYYPQQIKVAHKNLDILVVNKLGRRNALAGSIAVFSNNGGGVFGRNVIDLPGISGWAVDAGDVNVDGVPDLVAIDGNITVILTGGQTRGVEARGHQTGAAAVAIADVNGDGQPDLVAAVPCITYQDCSTGAAAVIMSESLLSQTTLTSSSNPSQVGQSVMFTAAITSKRGPIPDGIPVTFFDGTVEIGSGITASGVATFTTSGLKAKTHSIKAMFPGCPFIKPSVGRIKQIVNP